MDIYGAPGMDQEVPAHEAKSAYQQKYGSQQDYIASEAKISKLSESDVNISFGHHVLLNYLSRSAASKESALSSSEQSLLAEKIAYHLKCGQNVACYGCGSKLPFIQGIARDHFAHVPKLVIKGFIPSLLFKSIVQNLLFLVAQCVQDSQDYSHKRFDFQLAYLRENLPKIKFPFILLVIHNIDGQNLREVDTQNKISQLAASDKIRLLVSFDHFRYALLLQPKTKENFRFVFMQCNTGQKYTEEFQYIQPMSSSKKDKKEAALKYVMESFTKNQKSIVRIVAAFLLANPEEPGITFKQLFEKCLDEMVVSSEMLLKENLLEILDHQVITQSENKNKIYYTMSYSKKAMQHIVDDQLNLIGASDSEPADN